ncbi:MULTISPECIES: sulfite exporter TauE/SafE family protein [Burkholderiaceae]|uniref:sulfite exporter TauE/SafE family protein n=1 Tax=Burkholderiaceae TaxID=119060 RepID=UPI00141F442A|nr:MULTISPECIES: sulfite exporter TauE/SafE family protein [Burkholderiaceae]MBN3847252.1 sulfite exporter TauE/SafE family protein [Paraburkholderia sp. Ac-20342]NIF51306.1 sulfite exporter TauE/SafE family protein [Burkholderia sp. Ax-1724]NIF77191.1 sulfite exporter TauE/SafE family protein [Paraburkholderia sp. Cy-641]
MASSFAPLLALPVVARVGTVAVTFVVAGFVKGVTGMGLPTVAMGVLGTLMLPAQAAALLLLPSFVTNMWQLFAGASVRALAQRLWPMMAGIVVGTLVAAPFIAGGGGAWAVAGLGAALMLYAAAGLLAWRFPVPARHERWLSPVIGVATGVLTGGTGVFVVPAVPYLQGLDLKKEDLVQALGLSFTVSTLALAIGLAGAHAFALDDLGNSLAAVLPALVGMWLGQRVRGRIGAASFRRWFFVCLLGLGVQLTARAFV